MRLYSLQRAMDKLSLNDDYICAFDDEKNLIRHRVQDMDVLFEDNMGVLHPVISTTTRVLARNVTSKRVCLILREVR